MSMIEHHRSSSHCSTTSKESPVIDTLWKACAYNELDLVREFVEKDEKCVDAPDEQGYSALQWAALNNRVAVISYLLEHGADVNRKDTGGQTALHWTAVKGSIAAAETLLRGGADPRLRDERGYSVIQVAAQYECSTSFLLHLALKWGVEIDTPDVEGRTPLHWAAYKNHTATLKLLLVMDARAEVTDEEGCTPLHWAAIKGNSDCATILLQAGPMSVLSMEDTTRCTPIQLAQQKNHMFLARHMERVKRRHEDRMRSIARRHPWLSWLLGTQLCPAIWLLILALLAAFFTQAVHNPTYPPLSPAAAVFAYLALACATAGLYLLYRVTTSDPGIIPRGGSLAERGKVDSDPEMGRSGKGPYSQLDTPALWAGNWGQLCVTCRIVRPLRAKHCAVTDRCIENFDHFCPWVGNSIGKGNRHLFLAFLWLEAFATLIAGTVAVVRTYEAGGVPGAVVQWAVLFVVVDFIVGFSVFTLAFTQLSQVLRNVTTNELSNWPRYKYLRDELGNFHNPFDRGWKANCTEVCFPAQAPPSLTVPTGEPSEKVGLLLQQQANGNHLE